MSVITEDADLNKLFSIGSWVRVGDVSSGPVFTVLATDTSHSVITLSSAYTGISRPSGVPLYYQRHNDRYQYVITFHSSLGDVPTLQVDTKNLFENFIPSSAVVTGCDLHTSQVDE